MLKILKNKIVKNLKKVIDNENQDLQSLLEQKTKEIEDLKPLYYWFKWYHSEYAATLRMLQYNQTTLDINNKLIAHRSEFIDIDKVIHKIIAPPHTNGPFTKEFIYFAARNVFLPDEKSDQIKMYSMSYLGNGDFAHSRQAFDAFIDFHDLTNHGEVVQLEDKAGLVDANNLDKMEYVYSGEYKHFRPFSYNTGDLDGDGKHDFILGDKLLFSSNNYEYCDGFTVPQEPIFLKTHKETLVLSLVDNHIAVRKYSETHLIELSNTRISSIIYENIPHVLFPLPLNNNYPPMFAIRSKQGLDIYCLNESTMIPELKWWITGFSEKEMLTGAQGEFIGNGYIDFWISQVATGISREICADQILLISSELLLNSPNGEIPLKEVLYFTVKGSDKYSDYDGISSSLSPIAGDIDGDGKPDLSFVGHRHMNEAGALYILLNKDIEKGGVIDITHKNIIKVLGKPMSQLAPPYVHWDATDLTGGVAATLSFQRTMTYILAYMQGRFMS